MAETIKYEIFTSPVGELIFPRVNVADTRFDKSGTFHTKLALAFDDPDTQAAIAQLEKARESFLATLEVQKQKTYKFNEVYELQYTRPAKGATEEEKASFVPEPTGNIEIKAKLSANVTKKDGETFTQKVEIVDINEDPLDAQVWGGSMAQIKCQIVPYTVAAQKVYGVTLRLRGVKVHELVTGTGSSWSSGY